MEEVQEEKQQENNEICKKCHDTGIVKEANGSCHTCWDCLNSGRLNQHSKDIPDVSRFKL